MIETQLITTQTLHVCVPAELRDAFETEVGGVVTGAPLMLYEHGWECTDLPPVLEDLGDGNSEARNRVLDFLHQVQSHPSFPSADALYFHAARP